MPAVQCDAAECLERAALHRAQGWGGKGAGVPAVFDPHTAPCHLFSGICALLTKKLLGFNHYLYFGFFLAQAYALLSVSSHFLFNVV